MIGIVFIGDLYVCPYLKIYTNQMDESGVEYEVLFWNRSSSDLNLSKNYIYFNKNSEEEQMIVTKLFDFIGYRNWLAKTLKAKKYDKLIILSTLSGIIIADILKKYKNKYFFDIRDYSYEKIKLFYKIEEKLIKNSYVTSISSPGFKNFLPAYDYVIAHNIQRDELQISDAVFTPKKYGETLNVVWNGTMRYFDHQRLIIDKLVNDNRFNVFYHGAGPELNQYIDYCKKINATNVFFTGRYNNDDKHNLLVNADIINNSYWFEKEEEILYAISNRFYDGLIYHIPQLVEDKTYKTNICNQHKIGTGIHAKNEDFADALYEWYFKINADFFNDECSALVSKVREDDCKYRDIISEFIKS